MDKLTEKMNKSIADAEAIFSKSKEEGRELTAEEVVAKDKLFAEIKGLRATLVSEKELAGMHFAKNVDAISAITDAKDSKAEISVGITAKPDDAKIKEIFNRFLRTADDKDLFTITTGTASGALVPKSVQTPIVVRRAWNAILNAVTAMNQPIVGMDSDSTETIVLPVIDDSAVSGQDGSEGATSDTAADPSVSTISLGATLIDSKSLWFSNTQLKALTYDLASYLLPILDKRCELQMDSDWTTKLLAAAVTGNTTTTSAVNGLTYAEFVKWYHALAPQFRVDGCYIISDGLLTALESLTDTVGRPLLSDALITGAVKTLKGCPVFISNSLLTPAASVVSGVFVSAGSLHVRMSNNKRVAVYQNLPTFPDQQGYRQFQNADFGVSAGAAFLKHAIS